MVVTDSQMITQANAYRSMLVSYDVKPQNSPDYDENTDSNLSWVIWLVVGVLGAVLAVGVVVGIYFYVRHTRA